MMIPTVVNWHNEIVSNTIINKNRPVTTHGYYVNSNNIQLKLHSIVLDNSHFVLYEKEPKRFSQAILAKCPAWLTLMTAQIKHASTASFSIE